MQLLSTMRHALNLHKERRGRLAEIIQTCSVSREINDPIARCNAAMMFYAFLSLLFLDAQSSKDIAGLLKTHTLAGDYHIVFIKMIVLLKDVESFEIVVATLIKETSKLRCMCIVDSTPIFPPGSLVATASATEFQVLFLSFLLKF